MTTPPLDLPAERLTTLRERGRRYGSPQEALAARSVKQGECLVWTGALTSNGYGNLSVNRRTVRAHRYAYEQANGPVPDGMYVDHICHNRACVNPDHLRTVTSKQNSENLASPHRDNTSGYLGVSWDNQRGRWAAQAQHHGRKHRGGYFDTAEDANRAAIALRNELFTHNSNDRKQAIQHARNP